MFYRIKIQAFFIVLLLSILPYSIAAQELTFVDGEQKQVINHQDIYFYVDSSKTADYKIIIQKYNQGEFQKGIDKLKKSGDKYFWYAFTIDNQTGENIYLIIKPQLIDYLIFYEIKNNIVIDSTISGIGVKTSAERLKISSGFIFNLKKGKRLYLLKTKSDFFLPFEAEILNKSLLKAKIDSQNLLEGIILGGLFITFLYHLIIWLFVRDRLYFYYLLYVFFALILFANFFSLYEELKISAFFYKYTGIFVVLMFSGALLFVREFSIQKVDFKGHGKIINAFFVFGAVCILSSFIHKEFSSQLLMTYSGLLHLYLFIFSVYIFRKNDVSTILFSAAWFISLLTFVYVHIVSAFFVLFDIPPVNIIMYGQVVNLLILSLVIGNHLNMYILKEKKAKSKELEAIRERDRIIAEQQEKLKKIVANRNREILEKIEELSGQQEELESQTEAIMQKNKEIDYLNKELIFKNKEIESQNKVLEENKQNLEEIVEKRIEELKEQKKKAEVADKLKSSFLNNLSNEIQSPLNAIEDFANILKYNKDISKERRDFILQEIILNIDTLLSLIEDVVTLSRIQAGIVKIKKTEINLEKFINLLAETVQEKLKETGKENIALKINTPENKNIRIFQDYDKLWQIFMQLLNNSIKYTNNGYIEIGFEISKEHKNEIVFFVKDTGKGISEEEINEFLSTNQKDDYHRKGLGLAIVKEFVRLLGGTIHVKSKLNNGTIFYFTLKLNDA